MVIASAWKKRNRLIHLEAIFKGLINIQDRQTSGASWLGSRLLLFYLRLQIKDLVKKCYPTVSVFLLLIFKPSTLVLIVDLDGANFVLQRMERADDWLINEMLRAVSSTSGIWIDFIVFSFDIMMICNYAYPTLLVSPWHLWKSYDPGVNVVLESIFSFNLSIPLNYLLENVKEKVLIIQVFWHAHELLCPLFFEK